MAKGKSDTSRLGQARVVVQARWGLPALPAADDVEVGWLLASGDPLTERYARALAELVAQADAFLGDGPREATGAGLGRVPRGRGQTGA